MSEDMLEIRWHGRGGQGAKTAAALVAQVAIEEGKFSQGFPEYGPERMGAPVRGFTRVSDSKITVHSAIYKPDVVVVLDESLIDTVDVIDGLHEGGPVIVNTKRSPHEVAQQLKLQDGNVWTVDATGIAIDEIGRPIPNTPMIGALVRATDALTMETLIKDLRKKFGKKFPDKVVEGNVRAVERAFKEAKDK